MPKLKIGTFVVYPAQGVARVESVETRQICDQTVSLYRLRVLETNDCIWVPIGQQHRCGLRGLVSSERAAAILKVFERPPPERTGISWIQISRGYEECLVGTTLEPIAEVYRDLLTMKRSGALSFGQIRLLERTRRMVLNELAVVLGRDRDDIAGMVRVRIARMMSSKPRVSTAI